MRCRRRLWETELLPRRVSGYRPSWLDDILGRGSWLWRAEGSTRGEPRVAFFARDFAGLTEPAPGPDGDPLGPDESKVLDLLGRMGASFAAELARAAGLEPSRVRRALLDLAGRGLATNDRLDPMRAGSDATLLALAEASRDRAAGRSLRIKPRRTAAGQAEGRWSRLNLPPDDPQARLLAWAGILLDRYGVLSREVVALEPSAPGWGELAPLLARAEWRGEVRRGYFVEGLSGVQYASEEAAAELARLAAHPEPASPVVLMLDRRPGQPVRRRRAAGRRAARRRHGPPAADPRELPGDPRRPPGPDRRIVRQAADRAALGRAARHRLCTEASSNLYRSGSTRPQG